MSMFFSIFLVQRDFCLGQEASIGPVWSGVRAERLFVSNRTVRSISTLAPNETFGLGCSQTKQLGLIDVLPFSAGHYGALAGQWPPARRVHNFKQGI